MEQTIWATYRAAGFRLIGVSTGVDQGYGHSIARNDALTFPIALDIENTAFARYSQVDSSTPPYPLGVLLDKSGKVRRIDTKAAADLTTLGAQIATLLAQ